ncbi:CBS domain-containing protein [Marinobacter oulmenensis]|uniref:CBS domain-containing protein n=1 Tax=Marinobacter oulmenensis TaxID=643747 RepID=A0A840UCF8_9GAMM|nr:CBS domain-containing protein [Marinobacter oulmenensis]MBB5320401.1 CBS domain-containing protein [Marinobacter oulmenensis]
MSIHVSEPGRPVGTRLPEVFRNRRVGDVTELTEAGPISASHSEATDAEFQQAAHSGSRQKALQEYGAAAGERPEERVYLPVSEISSPAIYTAPATATVGEALGLMEDSGVHHLVILAENNVAGLLDLRWLLSWLHENTSASMNQSLVHIELPAFLTASPETDAHQLARLMLAHQLNAALVVDTTGKPTGIVTSTDYLKLYANVSRQEGAV